MASSRILFGLKLKLSLLSVAKVLTRPMYLLITLGVSWLFLGVLVWLTNISLLRFALVGSSLSIVGKLDFVLSGYRSIITNFEPLAALLVVLLSILFGINTALLVFVKRGSLSQERASSKQSFGAALASVVSVGCAACGTSILAPLLSGVGAAASVGFVELLGVVANIVAFSLLAFSIYTLGQRAATVLAKNT